MWIQREDTDISRGMLYERWIRELKTGRNIRLDYLLSYRPEQIKSSPSRGLGGLGISWIQMSRFCRDVSMNTRNLNLIRPLSTLNLSKWRRPSCRLHGAEHGCSRDELYHTLHRSRIIYIQLYRQLSQLEDRIRSRKVYDYINRLKLNSSWTQLERYLRIWRQ